MRDLRLAKDLIVATKEGTDRPVTLKMRLGWDYDSLNSPELAKIAQEEGVELVTVHGRTRCQFYDGQANWKLVKTVKDTVKIPVIVNGDIDSIETAKQALSDSDADGIMAGRSFVGRPWALGEIAKTLNGDAYEEPTWIDKIESMTEQITDSVSLYGERLGVRVVRKHLSAFVEYAYVKSMNSAELKVLKKEMCTVSQADDLITRMRHLKSPQNSHVDQRELMEA
jgi:tRNA-dihydrouridine synthase